MPGRPAPGLRPARTLAIVCVAASLAASLAVLPAAAQSVGTRAHATAGRTKAANRSASQPTTRPTKKASNQPSPSARAATASRKPLASVAPVDVGNPREAQAEQTAERDRLTARIAELKQQIAAGERSRSGATLALQRAEHALTDVNRQLAELARRQREGQDRIAGLERQRTGTAGQIEAQRSAFGRTARMLDANRSINPAQAFAGGGDPGEPMMAAVYLRTVALAQAGAIDALEGRARDLQAERQRADDEVRQLLAESEEQKSARDDLSADRLAQKKSLDQLTQQLAQQRSAAAALAANEQRLSRVVEQLQRVIERQAAEERSRREAARREAERREAEALAARKKPGAPQHPSTPAPAVPVETPETAPSAATGAFAGLRGRLRLPVRGTIVGRFGAPRGSSGATWKGVFIRTDAGAEVRAIAAGKVVFADDLRGFGNLVIIDHGDQYLSIYGNNQALLKRAGETVRQGDAIARAGDSSGDQETGLYFELRFRGRPFDPLGWTGSH